MTTDANSAIDQRMTEILATGMAAVPSLDARVEYQDLCVHDAFERQVALTPDALAVVDGERQISYAELRMRARRLAFELQSVGVGTEAPVALVAERSVEAVVGILGILQARGAYVPIDPHDTDKRISTLIDDVGAVAIVTQPHLRDRLRAGPTALLELSGSPVADAADNEATLTSAASPDDLAAVVYTSGTTGKPKGIEIPHRSIMARVRNGYRPRRHDLQKAPLSVVAHFSDLLLPLLCGGPVIFVPDAVLSSGRALLNVVRRYGTTRMVFVPSQLSALLESGNDAVSALRRLDAVIVSGEPLTHALVTSFKRLLPHVVLMNAYGASEVAGLVCTGEVSSPDDITVGNAIPGCAIHVLDDDRRPLPPGVPGYVYLGGAQLARGYRNNASLTAEHFVSDPLSANQDRMYCTGDIAERLPDGRLRIIGRRDSQVKVHGFRVTLSDIEALLECIPGVQGAVVTYDGADDQQHLTAHMVARFPFDPADSLRVRDVLATQLPWHMVPGRIRFVPAFPLLPNGKVDRLALAASDSTVLASEYPVTDSYVAPKTGTERTLAHIWQTLLGVSLVSTTDDFFALGGDSLDATRFILRAEALGLTVTLEQLEHAPSLALLARAIDDELERDTSRSQREHSAS